MAEPVDTGPPLAPLDTSGWPESPSGRTVFLLDAASGYERALLEAWIAEHRPAGVADADLDAIAIPSSRGGRRRIDPHLEARLAAGDDPLLAPLRVCWLPRKRNGRRNVLFRDVLFLNDPRDPGRLRQRWIRAREPDRCRIVAGEPAPASELRERWRAACGGVGAETLGLADFVARQAALALERAERRLRGTRYKVPRFVHEEVLSRPQFRGGVERLARSLGRDSAAVTKDAARYLKEIAATHSPFVIDLVAGFIHWLYTRGYAESIDYDREQLEGIYALAQRHPVVFLPTHKSNLDHLSLQYVLHENGHPPNHTAGGINMNFFPLGPLWRRSGVFFIRRSFKDNEVYKFVLRQYVDYLVEKRFPLEWYIEGGRSRSGKMLPPRYGMLAYVVDSYRRAKSDDVVLLPVSIAYDQIQDVGSYAAEQSGGKKQAESFGWFLGVIRSLRRPYGRIHVRFGEPLSLSSALGPPDADAEPSADEESLATQKIAFAVSARINRATPITASSLVTMVLLGRGDRAMSVEQVRQVIAPRLEYVRRHKLPTTGDLDLDEASGVRRALDALARNDVLTCYDEGPEPVYGIEDDQHLTAAYYRNTIVHFFVNPSICELALLRAAEPDVEDPVAELWREAMALRDLLKFEFFFAEKDVFRAEIAKELVLQQPDWENRVAAGPESIMRLLLGWSPLSAHRAIRPFVEAYRVVSDELETLEPAEVFDEGRFLNACLKRGRQYRLQRRMRSEESVSKVLFQTALRLARNRGLLDPETPELRARRSEFARELRRVARRIQGIDALAESRRVGVL
ncbi:MAG TPA: glycerol-3-phosphate 1-O-acyltransferase [Myxococcota bacterium]|nr:glycerol-3-phosphate 1-O-acyltransferase [Myxococcota bacterium]